MITTRLLLPRRSNVPTHALALRDFDRLFDSLWRSPGAPTRVAELAPRIDVHETEAELRVSAELPGLDETDIEVSLENDVLTIRGERAAAEERDAEGVHHRETFRGTLQRSLRLRSEVDIDAVTAVYRNGILTVTLPKAPAAQVRSIPVTGASEATA
jgi:HSP20 family protein